MPFGAGSRTPLDSRENHGPSSSLEIVERIRDTREKVPMSVEQAILDAVRSLPLHQKQEILSLATRLRDEAAPKKPFRSIKGILAGRGISISAEEIDQARREMWRNFPSEDI